MTTIHVRVESQYGNVRIFPLDFVDELRILTKQKTLTREQITALRIMGFEFIQVKDAQDEL